MKISMRLILAGHCPLSPVEGVQLANMMENSRMPKLHFKTYI